MKKELLERASKINAQIYALKEDIRDLRNCKCTLGIVHWSNYSVSYHTHTEVSQDIIDAIIAEKERKVKELQKQFEEL